MPCQEPVPWLPAAGWREDRRRRPFGSRDTWRRECANLASLAAGVSHGCHRLLGRNVVRLADFVLTHRDHVRHGEAPTYYRRVIQYGGSFPIAIDSLGYRIELVPPIPIDALPGRIHR